MGEWAWTFRPERMYLIPGDSPMGLRLPLDSIPWVKKSEYPHIHQQDPMEVSRLLPDRASMPTAAVFCQVPKYQTVQGVAEQTLESAPARARPGRRTMVLDLPPAKGQSAPGRSNCIVCGSPRRNPARVHASAEKSGRLSCVSRHG